MKSGLMVGQSAEVEVVVTKDMRPAFAGPPVHDLYATSALVHDMEWAARKLILPYLEPHEEGMGSHIEVSHLMPTLPGMKVIVRATVSEVRENKVVCDLDAFNVRGKIARGTMTQAIIDKEWLDKRMKEMSIINQLSGSEVQVHHAHKN